MLYEVITIYFCFTVLTVSFFEFFSFHCHGYVLLKRYFIFADVYFRDGVDMLLCAWRTFWLRSRITSYNVCYTKLLRLGTLTISSYIADLEQLGEFIDKPLLQTDTNDVLKFLATFKNKRTLNRKLSSINAFFHFCHLQNFTHDKIKIPMAKIPQNLPKS